MSIGDGTTPNPFPDNLLFENEHGEPQICSWNGEINGVRATYGVMSDGAEVKVTPESTELIIPLRGALLALPCHPEPNSDGELRPAGWLRISQRHELITLEPGYVNELTALTAPQVEYICLYPDDFPASDEVDAALEWVIDHSAELTADEQHQNWLVDSLEKALERIAEDRVWHEQGKQTS